MITKQQPSTSRRFIFLPFSTCDLLLAGLAGRAVTDCDKVICMTLTGFLRQGGVTREISFSILLRFGFYFFN